MDVIKLLSNPPDNKHAMGLSVLFTRFSTAFINESRILLNMILSLISCNFDDKHISVL